MDFRFLQSLAGDGLLEFSVAGNDFLLQSNRLGEVEKMIRMHTDLRVDTDGIDVTRKLPDQLAAMQEEIVTNRNRFRLHETR